MIEQTSTCGDWRGRDELAAFEIQPRATLSIPGHVDKIFDSWLGRLVGHIEGKCKGRVRPAALATLERPRARLRDDVAALETGTRPNTFTVGPRQSTRIIDHNEEPRSRISAVEPRRPRSPPRP